MQNATPQILTTYVAVTPTTPVPILSRLFSTTPSSQVTAKRKTRSRDPYVLAQAAARKAANVSRQEALKKQRSSAYGDPVKGVTTPFVQSFDTGVDNTTASTPPSVKSHKDTGSGSGKSELGIEAKENEHLNSFLTFEEVNEQLRNSFLSAAPLPERRTTYAEKNPRTSGGEDPQYDPEAVQKHEEEEEARIIARERALSVLHRQRHDNAVAALAKLVDLNNGSSGDRARTNTQRCIDTFGRHKTDLFLEPRPLSIPMMPRNEQNPESWVQQKLAEAKATREANAKERGGADTGSSEVQIAILTAKIRTLSQFLETRGKGDKATKRNLRLLVHKRQKLLKYLWRKEKGGPRWQNCIETLGLTEATWKGEISL